MQTQEFARRRRELMRMMGPRQHRHRACGPHERIRNRDSHYPFRQDSDFHYLSGFPEPDAVAVLVPGRSQAEYILFCRERDPRHGDLERPARRTGRRHPRLRRR